ncbi:ISAzo13 family transposase [Paenibacillus alginolyticus]|uniref:ISAzo13 family transposase n=2 Tax=Paenibacillus alginolyticus TaxID=59839 RepID=UPI00040A1414|nr:ISAzo13 family transposase [Paenibacillus alginolyticus]MCY9669233.1 ISAzo13 family transposase [Paenibacillus alginolyticus]
MIPEFIDRCKEILIENTVKLTGTDKRVTLAKMAKEVGRGGRTIVSKIFKTSRNTINKGFLELESGIPINDNFSARGRHLAEEKLPNLLEDLKSIIDPQSQTDPSFKSVRLFTRLTVKEIRKKLIQEKNYTEKELPTNQTLNTKVNQLGYTLKKVRKVKPMKKIEQTDVIFENLNRVHEAYGDKDNAVRISVDTKDRVKIGDFSRGGYNRALVKAADHDFSNEFVTPFGIYDVTKDAIDLSFTKSKVTADFMVDAIEKYWMESDYHLTKDTLILNADNGPENSSRRIQFLKRIVEFSARYNVKIILAYYPPYHSKYNPIERIWGRLEQHWNGDLLSNLDSEKFLSKKRCIEK